MSKKTTYIVHYKYEVDATNTTEYSHYLIDAVDKEGAKDLWFKCYKDEEDTLVGIITQPQWEKDEIKKSREERRKYHENRLKNKGAV